MLLRQIAVHRYDAGPIPVPITPDAALVQFLTDLNTQIEEWGYMTDTQMYVAQCKEEYAAAKAGDNTWAAWTDEKGRWLNEADEILEEVNRFFREGWMEGLSSEVAGLLWQYISTMVWQMQYMTAFLQVYLDLEL